LWVRVLYQSFGSTIQSVTTVVAAYMGGLGLGAWLLGRFADRHPRPAALYGWLEVAIGVFGVLSPAVLAFTHGAWIAIAGTLDLGPTASIAVRFGLAALVLGIPTTLMGGTLPVLTRALTGGAREALQPQLGKLYGLNTLGAVLGAAVAGFVLIEHVGIRASLWLTALANLALGAIAVVLARPLVPAPAVQPDAPVATPGVVTPAAPALRATAFVLLTVTAFAGLLDEIAWTRVLVMVIGGSTYAFTLVLVVFLLGIGIGSALVARRSHPPPETAATASAAQGISAAGAAVLLVFLGVLPRYIVAVFHIPGLEATGRLVLFGVAIGAVVLIPAVGMGMTFPLLTDLAARRDAARATDVGRAYALNTAGSIMGAALTGFVLVGWLGSDFTLRIGGVLSAGAALLLAVLAARGVPEASDAHRRLRWRVLCGGILGVAALAAAFATPRWDNRLIDLGPTIYGRNVEPGDQLATFLSHRGGRQMTFREGRNATVSVWESQIGRTLKINGKADASDHGDMDTQVMLGLAPVAARAGASSALVIGFGSGVTARVLSDTPGMRTVPL
jgi:predicted membrane-bound spermidine synthase